MSEVAKNKTVYWITGASSGIGKALALQLALPENSIILSGRNEQALQEIKQVVEATSSAEVIAFRLVPCPELGVPEMPWSGKPVVLPPLMSGLWLARH